MLASASFFWMSWKDAIGFPNCFLSENEGSGNAEVRG